MELINEIDEIVKEKKLKQGTGYYFRNIFLKRK